MEKELYRAVLLTNAEGETYLFLAGKVYIVDDCAGIEIELRGLKDYLRDNHGYPLIETDLTLADFDEEVQNYVKEGLL